ncbi:hypothetical protein IG631_13408 [Alternaria alternata]|nr:hypothetical protein IG631_13408 [Alternaria alternata]
MPEPQLGIIPATRYPLSEISSPCFVPTRLLDRHCHTSQPVYFRLLMPHPLKPWAARLESRPVRGRRSG